MLPKRMLAEPGVLCGVNYIQPALLQKVRKYSASTKNYRPKKIIWTINLVMRY